jgi:hypothetical protein
MSNRAVLLMMGTAGCAAAQPPAPPAPNAAAVFVRGITRACIEASAAANRQTRMLSISYGTADVLLRVNREFKAYLDFIGVQARYTEIPARATCGPCGGGTWPFSSRCY